MQLDYWFDYCSRAIIMKGLVDLYFFENHFYTFGTFVENSVLMYGWYSKGKCFKLPIPSKHQLHTVYIQERNMMVPKEFCNRGRGLSAAETASHSSITNFLTWMYIVHTTNILL